jgi:transketolase
MRKAFGQTIAELAEKDEKLVLLHGDVEQEMGEFKRRWPKRIFNLGLCEQSIISMAAGMALEGLRPVVYSITPFVLERPFEQIKIDIDEQNLPVLLIGYSHYPSHGPTHTPLDWKFIGPAFKNMVGHFPETADGARFAMLDAYTAKKPAFICLKKAS